MILIFSFSGLVTSVVTLDVKLGFGIVMMLILLKMLLLFGIVITSGPVLAFVAPVPAKELLLLLVVVRDVVPVVLPENPDPKFGLLPPVPKEKKKKRNLFCKKKWRTF